VTTTSGTLIGANIHAGGGDPVTNQKLADVMSSRRLMNARMDFTPDSDVTAFRDQVLRLQAKGIKAETSLQSSYQWDHSCNQNVTFVEQDAYNQTVSMVDKIKDVIQDFELLNEVSLRSDTAAQVTPYKGTPALGYAGKSCYTTLAAVLRGMSRAVVDRRNASGLPLRVILGAVSNDFGFLQFMQQQGVTFDVVGYHAYPKVTQTTLVDDNWYGPGGPLAQLALFNKPVRINEFNCGEIYGADYTNQVQPAGTDNCLSSIQKHLKAILAQKLVRLETVHAYEIIDRPSQAVPENRFGLMYDLDHPKLHVALYSSFAGGYVSPTERQQLDALGVKGQ
jgi:hypothetical protein